MTETVEIRELSGVELEAVTGGCQAVECPAADDNDCPNPQ